MSDIAVIGGTGALGGALAQRLAAAGIAVVVGSRDPAKAEIFADEVRQKYPAATISGAGLADAAAQAQICFVTVPYAAQLDTLGVIAPHVAGKIVVDATVPLRPPKVGTVQLPASGSAVVDGAAILGEGVRVVSALQNVAADKLGSAAEIESDVLICGDDAAAVEEVRELLGRIGLRSWHAGPLANSAATEAMTSLLIQINRRYKIAHGGIRITGTPMDGAPQADGAK